MSPLPAAVILGDLYLVRCFHGTEIPLVIAGSDPTDPIFRSRYARRTAIIAPWEHPENALADLERLAASFDERPVLLYDNDEQLKFVSRHREQLAPFYRLPLPAADLVEALVDKREFGRFARVRGLPVPRQIASRDVDGPEAALAKLRLPCVIKPDLRRGWWAQPELFVDGPRKAFLVKTPVELRTRWTELARGSVANFVVQEYIPGGEDRIYSFHAYVDATGVVKGWFLGKKIRTFPRSAGISTFLELVHEPGLAELGLDIVERTGIVGPMKMDFKRDPAGRFHLLEINARFNLWHHLGAASGVNLPLVAYQDLTGSFTDDPPCYTTEIRWLSLVNDVRTFLRSYRPSGALRWRDWIGSLRGRVIYEQFQWDDPMPFLTDQYRYARAVVRRLASGAKAAAA
ncbi:MAG: ATP-grasp domain-containing protein [Deltaproteobacteria bacterium]|nr:ATP-grasp domain-containing protein [Deltaproteobacteria bacterium]MCW5802136.1 ATP-grasp domain-containing protein [Deltaproteobacteria bacterium]